MRGHIVVFFGLTRSGKDTLINLVEPELIKRGVHVFKLSSIDIVKKFFSEVNQEFGVPIEREIDQEERQGLADVKVVIDKLFGWTVDFAIHKIEQEMDTFDERPVVLLYQVREIQNIIALREACLRQDIGFTAVFVHRIGNDATGAINEHYSPSDWKTADVVVINDKLEYLSDEATLISSRIIREFNLGNQSGVHQPN